MNKSFLTTLFLSVTSLVSAYSQDTTLSAKPSSATPFYKWEVGIDLLPLIDKQKDAFGYIVKRNFQLSKGRSAIRIKIFPRIQNTPLSQGQLNSTTVNLAIGYERQHILSQFAYLYGIEPYFTYFKTITTSNQKGLLTADKVTTVGMNGFFGGRFYASKHMSFTLESHLVYKYYSSKVEDNTGLNGFSSASSQIHQFYINPVHTLYVSYHL